ncbi:MAG: efflux transporter outer membrane subunit [Desulfobacteraceae bacterium]|nr:efflux transporter outer membrane subunit [Desulfobacteraceae bacterium]MBC2757882.1 efflux transporter outer membrane subunit [Desulfobacteraceae bacterium]
MKSLFIRIISVFAGLLLSACTMGPDFQSPDLKIKTPEAFQNSPDGTLSGFQELENWWQIFDDPEIDQIVKNVIQNNLDIQIAAARVLEIQSIFKQVRADQYPTLGLSVEAGRRSYSAFNPLTGDVGSKISDSYNLSLPASYEVDLWGRLSRSTEAAKAELFSAEENRRTVVQTIIAEAVNLYLNIESLERQIQVNHKSVDAFRQSLEVVEGRYRRGLTTILDVRQASRILAQAESQLPAFTAALGLQSHALAILQGQYPKNKPPRDQDLDYFRLPPEVPPGLPSDLIARRPDIAAAEASLHSACAQIGVAKASRFPQIKLTGTFGYASDELNSLFNPESELWSIAAGGMQSVFNAGKLAANQRAAQARYEQTLTAYSKTVLQAFGEVEGALLNRKELIDRRSRLLKYRDEAAATLDVANDRYGRGLVDYLTVLDSQQVRVDAELQLIAVEYELLSNHVSLCRALGGGWDLKMTEG